MTEKQKKRNVYNQDILEHLQTRYGFSLDYIRKSLRGDRIGLMPEKIIVEYAALEQETRRVITEYAVSSW